MKSRGGTLGAGGLDAPGFVARPARVLRGRGRAQRGCGRARALEAGDGWRRGASAGWRAGVHAPGGSAAGFYLPQTRHDPWRGTAAPRSVAWQALPRQRSVLLVAAMSALCRATMHGATQAFSRARAIGVAKSVSFKKNQRCYI